MDGRIINQPFHATTRALFVIIDNDQIDSNKKNFNVLEELKNY